MSDDIQLEASFAATIPLPFRVLFLAGTGILCWATNLHGLYLLGVNPAAALEYKSHDPRNLPSRRITGGSNSLPQPAALYRPVYRLFLAYSIWTFVGWIAFRAHTSDNTSVWNVDTYKYIPSIVILVICMVLVSPFNYFGKHERDQFIQCVKRCISSPLSQPIFFSDVVMADIFTSFAKVLGDVWLSLCMLLPGGSLLVFPRQEGLSQWVVPCLMSVPYLVRFRQCIVEYIQPTNISRKPLYNAIKYASAFPVIFLSAAQRVVVEELVAEKGEIVTKESWHGEHPLFRLWLLAAAVNTFYSYWWDLTNDWGLDLLRSSPKMKQIPSIKDHPSVDTHQNGNGHAHHSSPSKDGHLAPHPWGLRSTLLFPLPLYPLAVFFNLILRFTWSIKLSSHLHSHTDGAMVIFWIEMAELLRRWMWVFFRVEWEVVRKADDHIKDAEQFELSGIPLDEDEFNLGNESMPVKEDGELA
ncbi:EXS-domain-containing protein [Rickenella mellea]|uniref:EXS-domain-containing protein n=1 Tax=Rickenella mellea TaxID=50990 RepID=A0A4Y7QEZ8_9AGAM|nr:EXS-domain-containing protein [Rickenella mellea]